MAVDEATLVRIRSLMQVLESSVTAALPLITVASDVRDRMTRLREITSNEDPSMVEEFFREFRALGAAAPEIEPANSAFRNALDILEVDVSSDFGVVISLSATIIATFVVKTAVASGRSPEEVWQEYVLRDSSLEGFV